VSRLALKFKADRKLHLCALAFNIERVAQFKVGSMSRSSPTHYRQVRS
jgi:hypothetical protein